MIDGALVGACVQRFVRFLVYGPYFDALGVHALMKRMHAIPIDAGPQARASLDAIERARAELEAGHVVCIFAEGAISRTGNLLPFKRGFERIVDGLDVPIIPVYLDRVWGSIFSFKGGRFFWKLPERAALSGDRRVRRAAALDDDRGRGAAGHAWSSAPTAIDAPPAADATCCTRQFIRVGEAPAGGRSAMADSTGQTLTYGRALVGSLLLGARFARAPRPGRDGRRCCCRRRSAARSPTSRVLMAGKVAGQPQLHGRPRRDGRRHRRSASIRTILTSKPFLAKAVDRRDMPGMVFLEDLRETIDAARQDHDAAHGARCCRRALLRRRYGGDGRRRSRSRRSSSRAAAPACPRA